MRLVLDDPRLPAEITVAEQPTARRRSRAGAWTLDLIAVAALFALAAVVRWPYLWDIPRFTDELQEVLWSLSITRGDIRPLTAVDSYYGPLWSYLLAGFFAVLGPSPWLPRFVALLLSAGLVVLAYLFARDVAGRWPAAIAAGLLLTSGGHIVIDSHTARSNSTTPLLTTAVLWLVYRAVADRRWDAMGGVLSRRRPDPRLLIPAGFLFGLALQTHISVIALAPGLALYALWQGRRLLRSPWPYLAALAAPLGYANMILFNLQNDFWSFRHARSLQEAYTEGRSTDADFYLSNLGALVQSLSRLLSGTIDSADNPIRFVYVAIALLGLALLSRRGGLLLALVFISVVVVLPYFNPRYGPILSGRYLIPLQPIGFLAIGCALAVASRRWLAPRTPRHALSARRVAALIGLALVSYPLAPLYRYYQEAVADGRTNQALYRLADAVAVERRPEEAVVLDEGLAQEPLGAGGTDLKAFRMLLGTRGIPYTVSKVTEADDLQASGQTSALFLMEAKKRALLSRTVSAAALSPEVPSASGSGHRYAVYRITLR